MSARILITGASGGIGSAATAELRSRGASVVGVGLEGAIPAERVESAAKTLARAALGRPVRDLATTRAGTIQYFLARRSPRRLLDALTNRAVRRMVKRGGFSERGIAAEPSARLSAR